MANIYELGTAIRMTAKFTDLNGTAVDPLTVTAALLIPGGVVQQLSVVKDDVGAYHADITPTLQGVYRYKFTGSGNVNTASEGVFSAQQGF